MVNFSTIPEALEAVRCGRMVIVVDDEDRENEGDLVIAAEHIDEAKMAFMIRHTGGVVCLALANDIADQLDLPPMVNRNTAALKTAFTVSIEAASGVTTGISAADRTATVLAAINPVASPQDLHRPGHVFPLRAQDGGVLCRAGHTEASTDLCRLAGVRQGAAISELMNDDGTMMRLPQIVDFAAAHDLMIISIADLIAYRRRTETFIRLESESVIETETGEWAIRVYRDALHGAEHVALVKGEIVAMEPALVRVHSECLTGDAFGSLHCDCGGQLRSAMHTIAAAGKGVVLYMRQEGRGIGLAKKIHAYKLQREQNLDTVEANERLGLPMDLREYGIGAQILKDVGVGHLRLMTNNPRKVVGLEGYGLHIDEQVPVEIDSPSDKQRKYLKTKKEKMGHTLRKV